MLGEWILCQLTIVQEHPVFLGYFYREAQDRYAIAYDRLNRREHALSVSVRGQVLFAASMERPYRCMLKPSSGRCLFRNSALECFYTRWPIDLASKVPPSCSTMADQGPCAAVNAFIIINKCELHNSDHFYLADVGSVKIVESYSGRRSCQSLSEITAGAKRAKSSNGNGAHLRTLAHTWMHIAFRIISLAYVLSVELIQSD